MQSGYFSAEHEDFRREVRTWLETEVLPRVDDWEEVGAYQFRFGHAANVGCSRWRSAEARTLFVGPVWLGRANHCGNGGGAGAPV